MSVVRLEKVSGIIYEKKSGKHFEWIKYVSKDNQRVLSFNRGSLIDRINKDLYGNIVVQLRIVDDDLLKLWDTDIIWKKFYVLVEIENKKGEYVKEVCDDQNKIIERLLQ